MKIAIVLCAIVAAVVAAPLAPNPDDFRNEYDRLLVITIQEKLADTEHFLARLSHQLVELNKSKSKAVKDQILLEIDTSLNFLAGAKGHLERELKRIDLNFLEKFNFEELLATGTVLYNDLVETQKHVKAVETKDPEEVVAAKPDDFRDEFDRLMVIAIQEKFADVEHFLGQLTHQLAELEKNKSKELKEQVLREIDISLNLLAGAKGHLERELKRTDLNFLEKFNLDEILATGTVLYKDLEAVQKKVKTIEAKGVEVVAAEDDFRNEYDRLLVALTLENFHKLEQGLATLSHQYTELEKSKDKTLKSSILREISLGLDFIAGAKGHLERELKRTDLNLVEKFNFEAALATGAVLTKDLTALEVKVKAV